MTNVFKWLDRLDCFGSKCILAYGSWRSLAYARSAERKDENNRK